MKAIVYLDRQHSGKPHSMQDRGAWGDLNQNGQTEVEEQESMLTARYLWYAERRLIRLGYAVLPVSDGGYFDRHLRVNSYASKAEGLGHIYIAAHLNAGGGKYGICFYDHRSVAGPHLAKKISWALSAACPEISQCNVVACSMYEHKNAWNTIKGVYSGKAIGICFEPAFLDQPKHYPLFSEEGLQRIGESLANGIDRYVIPA